MNYKRGLAVVSGCVIAGLVAFAATFPRFHPQPLQPVSAAGAPVKASAPSLGVDFPPLPSKSPMSWARLTAAERTALAPFAPQWDSFSEARQRKWVKIASRYAKLPPDTQKRMHDQMTAWVRMTPEQRRVARENYQVSKALPPQTKQNAWKAYQELPDEQKQRLAASEHKRRPTVVSAPPSGKSEIKDINRLVNARERGASDPAPAIPDAAGVHATPSSSASAASAVRATQPVPASTPVTGRESPPTPASAAPYDTGSTFKGS